jgi:hypothetical protein
MTLDQFDETPWGSGMLVHYFGDDKRHAVAAVNFPERLVGLSDGGPELSWVRCENVAIIQTRQGRQSEGQP